jgi:hypothetical protein
MFGELRFLDRDQRSEGGMSVTEDEELTRPRLVRFWNHWGERRNKSEAGIRWPDAEKI